MKIYWQKCEAVMLISNEDMLFVSNDYCEKLEFEKTAKFGQCYRLNSATKNAVQINIKNYVNKLPMTPSI